MPAKPVGIDELVNQNPTQRITLCRVFFALHVFRLPTCRRRHFSPILLRSGGGFGCRKAAMYWNRSLIASSGVA